MQQIFNAKHLRSLKRQLIKNKNSRLSIHYIFLLKTFSYLKKIKNQIFLTTRKTYCRKTAAQSAR